ncbi:MAG: polysaccharide biosynthesis/export family protein [Candidatus Delongbacteria bacterium]|nr:polysaccharide biosynthesis/export family protein [Candidatus Delongbacteria bacterium]
MVYFQPEDEDAVMQAKTSYTPVFKKDDFISVIVTADDAEATAPFNFPIDQSMRMANSGYTQGNPVRRGYLIDENGNVSLPVIGEVHLAGKTRSGAVEMLETIYEEYFEKPVVNMHIENYKITVLGDVNRPGTYKIPNERITILEAIGLAGDLKMSGVRTNVLVIREHDGEKKEYRVDLTSKNILASDVYYLEQNDVVYIEPNNAARAQGTFWRTTGTIFISLTSLVVTTLSILFK